MNAPRVPRERAFNILRLAEDIQLKLDREGLTHQQAAALVGMPASSFTWICRHHRRPDVDTLVKLLTWLGQGQVERYTLPPFRGRFIGRPQ